MASFDFDQAEGLRRMLQGPRPRIVTFLSATPEDDKGAMLVNLGASLAQLGNDVLIVDACEREYGVARRLGIQRAATLAHVARQECGLNQVLHPVPQGFSVASLGLAQRSGSDADARRLAKTFDVLVKQSGVVMVDGELGPDGELPLPLMAASEIVVQVGTSATSITNAYALIKHLSHQLGRRPFGILVTGATEAEAKVVYDNMSTAATRYLAVTLNSMGAVPADEYLHRAARLGRSVVDAFPLAGASVAFRQLAGKFALHALPQPGRGGSAQFGS